MDEIQVEPKRSNIDKVLDGIALDATFDLLKWKDQGGHLPNEVLDEHRANLVKIITSVYFGTNERLYGI